MADMHTCILTNNRSQTILRKRPQIHLQWCFQKIVAFLIMQLYTHFTKTWIALLYNLNANAEDLNPGLCNICKNITMHKMFHHIVNSCLYKSFSSF